MHHLVACLGLWLCASPAAAQLGMGEAGPVAVLPQGVERPARSWRVDRFRPDADVNGCEIPGDEPFSLAVAALVAGSFRAGEEGPALVARTDADADPRAAAAFLDQARGAAPRPPARPGEPGPGALATVETLKARFEAGRPVAVWISSRAGGHGLVAFRVDEFPDRFEILAHDPADPPNLRGFPQLRRVTVAKQGGKVEVILAAFRTPDPGRREVDAVQAVEGREIPRGGMPP